jgi:hypothetical protein
MGCGDGQLRTVGRRTGAAWRQGSAAGRAAKEGSVGLVGAREG